MSGELDLSLLLAALRRRWWLIALSVVVALAIAGLIGLSRDRHYEATNTLLVQSPRYQWRFTGEIVTVTDQNRDYQREVLAIARNAEVSQAATTALTATGQDAAALASSVAVRAGDGNTIIIAATTADPEQSAAFAKAWTQALVEAARDLYGAEADLSEFEAKLAKLDVELQQAEDALAVVRARTGLYNNANLPDEAMKSSIALQQLNLVNATLAPYLVALQTLDQLQTGLAAAATATERQQLPWELLDTPLLAERGRLSAAAARATLADPAQLTQLLQSEQAALQPAADALSAQATQLRGQLAMDWQQYENAFRLRNQIRDSSYSMVWRKVTELQLRDQLEPSLLSIVGSEDPIVTQVRASMLGLLATAAIAGLILGTLLAVWLEASKRR